MSASGYILGAKFFSGGIIPPFPPPRNNSTPPPPPPQTEFHRKKGNNNNSGNSRFNNYTTINLPGGIHLPPLSLPSSSTLHYHNNILPTLLHHHGARLGVSLLCQSLPISNTLLASLSLWPCTKSIKTPPHPFLLPQTRSSAAAPPSSSSLSFESESAADPPSLISEISPTNQPQPQRTISSSHLPGTKPWTNNLTLTSFGLREMDSFFFSSGGGESGGGGGQPLQTLVMLEEDRLSDDLARALCRYWCAEGVAQCQMVLMGSLLPGVQDSLQLLDDNVLGCGHESNYEGSTPEELREFIYSLPRNLHLDKFRSKLAKQSSDGASTTKDRNQETTGRESISAIIEEDEDEEEGNEDDDNINDGNKAKDEGLINAWQYRKSVQDARSGITAAVDKNQSSNVIGDGVYCHSYDLSKRMWDQYESKDGGDGGVQEVIDNPLVTNTKIFDCSEAIRLSTPGSNKSDITMECQQKGMALFCCIWKQLRSTLSTNPNTVIRLFLHRLPVGIGAVAMPLLMSKIRKENLPVVVLTTIRPWKWLSSSTSTTTLRNNNNKLDTLASLRTTTDVTLSLDSFSSLRTPPPPEFSLLQGILTVRKCASFTTSSHYTDTVTWKRPLAERFGIKRDGRKVTVSLLHLPPEEYSKGGSSTGGGVRSGGGNVAAAAGVADGHGKDRSAVGGGCSSLGVGGGGASLDF